MAKKSSKAAKKASPKKAAKKKAVSRKAGKGAKKSAKKASPAKKAPKKAAPKKAAPKKAKRAQAAAAPTPPHFGSITHTDFSSHDPVAMKHWATKVFGWSFKPAFKMADGTDYELFSYSEQGGGGIARVTSRDEAGSVPYIHVADCQVAFDRAISAGGEQIMAPNLIMPGMKLAIVRAPGGATIGLSGP